MGTICIVRQGKNGQKVVTIPKYDAITEGTFVKIVPLSFTEIKDIGEENEKGTGKEGQD